MDNIRKEISILIDNLENKNTENRELDTFKYLLISSILKTTTPLGFSHTGRLIGRIKRFKSKNRNIYSKFNNMSKIF